MSNNLKLHALERSQEKAAISEQFQALVVELSEKVVAAEEEQIKRVLTTLGLPTLTESLSDHVEVSFQGAGRKILVVNGKPVAWIITESPMPDLNKDGGPVGYRFTVRAEPYNVAV